LIQFDQVSLRRGTKLLLEEVCLTVHRTQKVGIIGRNGMGKSSLMALLQGLIAPDAGEISLPGQLKIAHLEQEVPALSISAIDYVMDGDQELRAIEKALADTQDGVVLAELHAQFSAIGGYAAKARAAQLMDGLGFVSDEVEKPVNTFSGGWRMRLNLARTLMCRSDLLLLDEPTNHLDLDAILWLEGWLRSYPGTILLISHDRDFLDAVVSHIIHFENRQLKLYTGNYSQFEVQRAQQLAVQQAAYEKQVRQREHLQKFIDRFKAKASKASQAQSRIKALARMETIQAAHVDSPFSFSFRETPPCSNPLIAFHEADLGYSMDKPILKNVSLVLSSQDRIGLIGPNGAGKTTFIQSLAGKLSPLKGELSVNPALKMGYFAQHQLDNLDLSASPLLHLQRLDAQSTEQTLRSYLGSFGFTGDQAVNPIDGFSGGEKSRLALALLIWQKPNLLLLDEPTNHLDLEMRHALAMALQEYQGAMIIVSHDRYLLRSCTDTLMLAADHKAEPFSGDLDAYEKFLKDYRRANLSCAKAAEISPVSSRQSSQSNKELRALSNKIKKLETEIADLNVKKSEIEGILGDEALYLPENQAKLNQWLEKQKDVTQKLEALERQWFECLQLLEG